MEWMGNVPFRLIGGMMASYRDYLEMEPKDFTPKKLREATSSLLSVANKRLRRMEEHDIDFGDTSGDNTIAGVKRFSIRGKDDEEVAREFKRVRNFLLSKQSSITGLKETYNEFIQQYSELRGKDKKDFNKMRKNRARSGDYSYIEHDIYDELRAWTRTWKLYNRLVNEGKYAPSSSDSNQVRNIVYSIAYSSIDESFDDNFDKLFEQAIEKINSDYESSKNQEMTETEENIPYDTSSFVFGSSD